VHVEVTLEANQTKRYHEKPGKKRVGIGQAIPDTGD
jgi:hypothetical protein